MSAPSGGRPSTRRRPPARAVAVAVGWAGLVGLVALRPSPTLGTRWLAVTLTCVVLAALVVLLPGVRSPAAAGAGEDGSGAGAGGEATRGRTDDGRTERARTARAREVGGAWAALLVGTVGTTSSATLLGDALLRGVGPAEPLADAAVLGAGVVLLGSGARTLLRGARWGRRLVAVAVALALLQLVVQPSLAVTLAVARYPVAPGDRTPADLGLEAEDVATTTSDGVRLAAWYLPPAAPGGAAAGGRTPAVVLLHGSGSTRASVLDHAAVLVGCGYGVLALDARGHGDSAGLPMEIGWFADADVRAGVDALAAREDVDGIGLVGLSMGGEEALTEAAADPRVGVVVAEGATARTLSDALRVRSGWHGWLEWTVTAIDKTAVDLLSTARPPAALRDAAGAIAPRPVLLVAGEGEGPAAAWIRDGAPGTTTLVDRPDTPHIGTLAQDPAAWRSLVCGALDDALR